jgi:curved DNA-binding protein CbpA
MTARIDVLLWAQRIIATKSAPAHQLLELPANATQDDAQVAFHKVARMAHPDLHRTGLTADELELVTTAYAIIANAYQSFRGHVAPGSPRPRTGHPDAAIAATPSGTAATGSAAQQMSSRALVYYRKAELALKRGDLKGALLQLKMAIGSDPASAFLRTALLEVETEVRKGP